MLTMRVGHDTDYLTNAVAKGREGYYTGAVAAGEPPGLWYGAGAEALGLAGEVDAEIMKALYTHGLDPRDPNVGSRETWGSAARIGNAPRNYRKADEIYAGLLDAHPHAGPEERAELRAQAAKAARQSVAFYDVVLSAPKSMTVLWVACERAANDARAAGDEQAAAEWSHRAGRVEEALMVGHRAVLDFFADKAGYARAGHHGGGGGQWVDGHQLIAAQFLQHDSRDKDPQLHVHGPVANKVLCSDGKWRAIDATLITQWKPAAAALGERVAEAFLWEELGARWETRPDGKARELVGVSTDSTGMFSKRNAAITPTLDALIDRFRAEVGRDPTASERSKLSDQAFQDTRRGKIFGGETREGQIARWAAEHSDKLGVELCEVAATVLDQDAGAPTMWSERDVVARALATMEDSRQSWTRSQLQFAISQALPGYLGVAHGRVGELLEGLTDKAEVLARHLNPQTGPQGLDEKYYRADGESVFVKPGGERYATDTQLLGEQELRAAAVRRGAPTLSEGEVEEILARHARSGRVLGADQAAALRGILTSGAAVEVLTAPAGTGKSFLVGTLAETWKNTSPSSPGPAGPSPEPGAASPAEGDAAERRVFGLAAGQRQADVLTEEGVTSRNIRRWLDGQARLAAGTATVDDEVFRLRSGDFVVVDEAGTADTASLVAIYRRCAAAGVKLLLVGDPKQLASVGPGGALADIAARGISYELAEVRRFAEPWEAAASLRLRDGDETVVAEYAKHGRLIDAGTSEQAEAAAARAWLADTLTGREALLVVGSNEAAARVSTGLRNQLVRLGKVEEAGVRLGMQDTTAGVGDLVQARRNAWHLEGWQGNTEAPINRSVYRVTATHPDGGGMTVARVTGRTDDGAEELGPPLQLPSTYVNEHVTLAYASTVHAALGRTVRANYNVLNPGTDPAAAYVQHTRGRETNVMFVVTRNTGPDAATGETHQIAPRTPSQVLADVIRPAEQDTNLTALTEAETAAERAGATGTLVDPMLNVINDALTGRTGRWLDQLAADGTLPEHHRVAFAADEARDSLDALLRRAELAGHDPHQVLRDAVTATTLEGAASVAQVLHFRVREALKDRLIPQVTSFADLLPAELRSQSRPGLQALAAAADARRDNLGAQLAAAPPQWAREALGPVPDDVFERAHWEERAGWAASYRELVDHTDAADPLGAAPPAGLAEKNALFHTAHTALDLPTAGAEEEQLSEGQLRNRVAAFEHELRWAPRYVADELEATHTALRQAWDDAAVFAAYADARTDPTEAEQLRAAAVQARGRAEELAPIVEQLEFADDVRGAWLHEVAVTRDKAERARIMCGIKGIDLDAPLERVTAEEWLDAHHAEQLAADTHRDITEHDLHDPLRDTTTIVNNADGTAAGNEPEDTVASREPVDMPAAESPPDDIRATAVPDPSERVDAAERARVPAPDQTAVTVDRARLVVAEINNRCEAEAALPLDADDRGDDIRDDVAAHHVETQSTVAGAEHRDAEDVLQR